MARNCSVTTPKPKIKDKDPPPGIITPIDQMMDDVKQTPDQQKEKRRITEDKIEDFQQVLIPRKIKHQHHPRKRINARRKITLTKMTYQFVILHHW
jgi:hypothetical protein